MGREEASSPGPTLPVRPSLTFRPDIEGLRAVAVGLVVVLHFGVTAVSGGYVGVDVFFVISGFLITSLLIDEFRLTERVSILAFYARRARRILPAACFVIAVTVASSYLQLGALVGKATAIDGQWSAGFAANFRFIRQGTDYFASSLPPSPLQHFWSLAVEEQFYLVWPSLLFGLLALGRRLARPTAALRVGVIAIVAGSLLWSVHLSRVAPTNAYFSPLTRAWELGAGALIAVFSTAISTTPSRARSAAAWAGLVMIVIAGFAFTATTLFPGYAAVLPVAGTAFVIAGGIGGPGGGPASLLGVAPLRWLGRISFSVYLWHWPVLVIAEERSSTSLSNFARVVCAAITLALSIASYYGIERPIRSGRIVRAKNPRNAWERSRRPLAVGAVAIAVAVSVSAITNNRAASAISHATRTVPGESTSLVQSSSVNPATDVARLQQQVQGLVRQGLTLKSIPPDVSPPVLRIGLDQKFSRCLQARADVTVKTCTFGDRTSRRTLVVFGDSHAMTWMPALDIYGRQVGYRVLTLYKTACAIPSLEIVALVGPYPQCAAWRANALRYIQALRPAAVVTASSRAFTTFDAHWLAALRTTMVALKKAGAPVVEIGRYPALSQDPRLCLTRPHADPSSCTGSFSAGNEDRAERTVVEGVGVKSIDIEPWYCADGRCPAIIDKRIAYGDRDHLGPQYVTDLEPLLAASLQVAGLR